MSQTELIQLYGAGAFGAVIGWYLYYINRYREEKVQLGDLVTIIGMIGGAAVTSLFKNDGTSPLFGGYSIGLAIGFFGYFITLIAMVGSSKNFDVDWFLDGRRRKPEDETKWIVPGSLAERRAGGGVGMGGERVDVG